MREVRCSQLHGIPLVFNIDTIAKLSWNVTTIAADQGTDALVELPFFDQALIKRRGMHCKVIIISKSCR
jgi:hypothetical protein